MHRGEVLPVVLRVALLFATATVAAQNAAITTDPPQDKTNPATVESFQLPTHGALVNAFVYVAAGAGPHPSVILLHGFPGNERNLDLAQAIRRAGWNVFYLDYRGSWGSPGDFSFTHCIEDANAAIAWLRDPGHAASVRADPKAIVLIGHSMGGFVALETGAADPGIEATIAISAADLGASQVLGVTGALRDQDRKAIATALAAEGMAPLAGTSPDKLADEVLANAAAWNFVGLAPKLANRPLFVITADDGFSAPPDALVAAVSKDGDARAGSIHFATDHTYSDQRIGLEEAVLGELTKISGK
jgi:uncharacterized protein